MFSRTAVNAASGVKTPMGGVATGLLVMLCLAVLMPYCAFIPKVSKVSNAAILEYFCPSTVFQKMFLD
jgi:MFS superfamily sulfate permease-like transporter